MTSPRVAIGPRPASFALEAVQSGGGRVVGVDERPEALIWLDGDMKALGTVLADAPDLRWVQLPSAGVERSGRRSISSSPR